MTPAARINAAIHILDAIIAGQPAEPALLGWARNSRFAGSGDRAAVRDLVFEALRRRDSLAALGGTLSGRGLMLGLLRLRNEAPELVFNGEGHAPAPLSAEELSTGVSAGEADQISDLPDWIWPDWSASLGRDAMAAAHVMRARAPVWLRVNLRRADPCVAQDELAKDGIETEANSDLPSALRVIAGERRIAGSTAYKSGMVELQDLSPQLACAALPLLPGASVLDYCAGGGGKALALAARENIMLTAHDISPARMADLPARAARAGVQIALSPPQKLGRDYDLVLIDVPCSGSGTWRRSPDAKWRLNRTDLDKLVETQSAILRQAARLVAPGGRLAYMTCSILDRENDDQITDFLSQNPDFTVEKRENWLTPHGSDGFYLSLMLRAGAR